MNVAKGGAWGDVVSNFETAGTNYQAALMANREFASANGLHFTTIILISDGAPTHYDVDPNTLEGKQGSLTPSLGLHLTLCKLVRILLTGLKRTVLRLFL